MKCNMCGKKIKRKDVTCPHCGKALAPEAMDVQELMDNMGEIHDELDRIGEIRERAPKTRRRAIIALIIIVVCLAAGWGTLYYFQGVRERAEQVAAEEQMLKTSAVPGKAVKQFLGENFADVSILDESSAQTALERVLPQFGVSAANVSFRPERTTVIGTDTYYRFSQVCDGIDVYGGEVVVLANAQGKPLGLHGRIIETDGLDMSAALGAGSAANAINEYVNKMVPLYRVNEGVQVSDAKKVICNFEEKTYLAYTANISGYNEKGEYVAYDVFVDADNGAGIFVFDTASYDNYSIYTVNDKFNWNMTDKTGAIEEIALEEIESGNTTAFVSGTKAAIDRVYNYFAREHSWPGLDGNNSAFQVFLNANEYLEDLLPPEKALYANDTLMFIETDMATGSIDQNVVAHEFAHGVMHHAAGLAGTTAMTENAAIAEGLADVFAELAEGTAPDWVHGDRRFTDVMAGYYYEVQDGVTMQEVQDCYRYSTVISRAAYRMYAEGIGTKKLGELFFRSLMMMTGYDDFRDFGTILELNAKIMMDNGTLSDVQFGIVTTALDNTGMRGAKLYQSAVEEIVDAEMLSDEETDPNEKVIA